MRLPHAKAPVDPIELSAGRREVAVNHNAIGDQYSVPLLDELRQVWACTTKTLGAIADDDTFVGVGGDSIAATLCLNEIEERFKVAIELEWLLDEATTLRQLSARVDELLSSV
jgi:acyl carrier protein